MRKILFLFIFTSPFVFSQSYETVAYGYWNNPSVWENGLVPPAEFSDSVIINHPVALSENLESYTYMRIANGGAICGHQKLTVHGKMDVYGFFELDTLRLDNGDMCHQGGASVLSYQMYITNGGSFLLTNGSLWVGPWFECRNSDFFYIGYDDLENNKIKLMQNGEHLILSGLSPGSQVSLTDLSGRILLEKIASGTELELETKGENQILILSLWEDSHLIFRSLVLAH